MQLFRTDNSDLTLYFSKDLPDHISKHSINRSRKYIVISDLEIPLHHFLHRCIINSDQSTNCYPFHADILQSEVFIKTQTYAHLALLFFSPYIGLNFVNTMSQNHSTTHGIPERDQKDNPALNTMGQYHG